MRFLVGLTGLFVVLAAGMLSADAQVPSNASPGAIMRHDIDNRQWQQNAPFLDEPLRDQELTPPDDDDLIIDRRHQPPQSPEKGFNGLLRQPEKETGESP